MSLNIKIEEGDEDGYFWFVFTLIKDDIGFTMVLEKPSFQTKLHDWEGLMDGNDVFMSTSQSHGEVSIGLQYKIVTFHISNNGGDGDGYISIKIPHSICKDAFTTAYEYMLTSG
jgi:hypothetical protein